MNLALTVLILISAVVSIRKWSLYTYLYSNIINLEMPIFAILPTPILISSMESLQ